MTSSPLYLIINGPGKGELVDAFKYFDRPGFFVVSFTTTIRRAGKSRKTPATQVTVYGLEYKDDDNDVIIFKGLQVTIGFELSRKIKGLYNTKDRTGIIVGINDDPVEALRLHKEGPATS